MVGWTETGETAESAESADLNLRLVNRMQFKFEVKPYSLFQGFDGSSSGMGLVSLGSVLTK